MRTETAAKVQVGPAPIQTAEDARMAWLRKEINDSELKEILGKFSHSLEPTNLTVPHPNAFERVDDAFERSLPDVEEPQRDRLKERLAKVEGKEKEREAAEKATPKPKLEAKSSAPVAVDPNKDAREAAEKVAARNARQQNRNSATRKSASTSK